jgi:hypothetical protein
MNIPDLKQLSDTMLAIWDDSISALCIVRNTGDLAIFDAFRDIEDYKLRELDNAIADEINVRQDREYDEMLDQIEKQAAPPATSAEYEHYLLKSVAVRVVRLIELKAPDVILRREVGLLAKRLPAVSDQTKPSGSQEVAASRESSGTP